MLMYAIKIWTKSNYEELRRHKEAYTIVNDTRRFLKDFLLNSTELNIYTLTVSMT